MKRILCFGDSLTYGTIPASDGVPNQRYDDTKRWTGLLQTKLSGIANVIEEGLPSRTIDKEDPRPGKIGRNGSNYLWPCVNSHVPLDAVVVWLGTNDTKDMFNQSGVEVANAHKQMITRLSEQLKETSPGSKIIIMSPPKMNPASEAVRLWYGQAQPKLAELPELYKQSAKELNVEFIDLYSVLDKPAISDGIHLSVEQNQIVADEVYKKLTETGII